MPWGRGVGMGAAPSPHWSPLSIPGSAGLTLLPCPCEAQTLKPHFLPHRSARTLEFWVEPSHSFVRWAVFGLEGEGWSGAPSPTCDGCQMCWRVPAVCRLRRRMASRWQGDNTSPALREG